MKLTLGATSLVLFLLSVSFLLLLTLFEASLARLSLTAEKILSFFLLVMPAGIGAGFGLLSITRKESRTWLGILGALLNGLFGLFHLVLLAFAG